MARFRSLSAAERSRLREEVVEHVASWAAAAVERLPATLLVANFIAPAQPAGGDRGPGSQYGEAEFYLDLNLELLRRFKGDAARPGARPRPARRALRQGPAGRPQDVLPGQDGVDPGLPAAGGRASWCASRGGPGPGPKKCLVLDLDNTLWGGVVGEDGPAGVKIGPGDPEGEAFLDFQRRLKALQARGVLLAVCSKNNPADAREVFDEPPRDAARSSPTSPPSRLLGAQARGPAARSPRP